MRRGPFYQFHMEAGAKMIKGGEWELPGHYVGPKEEHLAVRERAGIIDFSSMGEVEIRGKEAFDLLQRVLVNDVGRLTQGRVLYSTMLNNQGGIIDDLTAYCFDSNRYWLVTSTANRAKAVAWLEEQAAGLNVSVTDISAGVGILCLQGPLSRTILQPLTDVDLGSLGYFWFAQGQVAGIPAIVSRTGYTGELGYEIYVGSDTAHGLWEALTTACVPHGGIPCGLIAAGGSLPLEKGYLGGRELNENTNPLEVGLGWTVRFNKGDFIGRESLVALQEQGLPRKLVGFVVSDSTKVAPSGAQIRVGPEVVGAVTSGVMGYTVGQSIGVGFIPTDWAQVDTEMEIEIDGAWVPAKQVKMPFYDAEGVRVRS